MAASLDLLCKACNQVHTFCLPDADMFTHVEYEYTCPTTQAMVRQIVDPRAMVAPGCSESAVIMKAIDG